MNNIQNNNLNFRAGRTIYWNQAKKYTDIVNKVSTISPYENMPDVTAQLQQYLHEADKANGNSGWVIDGILRSVYENLISAKEAMERIRILSECEPHCREGVIDILC